MGQNAEPMSKIDRSRGALLDAFRDLVLRQRYDDLKVSQIVAKAKVARSTFYAHYRSKDDLLLEGLSGPFAVLADAILPEQPTDELAATLQHFWDNRGVARALLSGPMRGAVHHLLVRLLEIRLCALSKDFPSTVPLRLVAHQIAGGQIALILAWIGGGQSCKPTRLAEALKMNAIHLAAIGVS